MRTRTCAYQGVRNNRFSENFGVLCFLETPILRFALLPYYRRVICYLEKVNYKFLKFHVTNTSYVAPPSFEPYHSISAVP